MGKAEIISGGTGGYYSVRLLYDKARAEDQIVKLNDEISRLAALIPTLETARDNAKTALDAATAELNTAITQYRNGEITHSQLMEKVQAQNAASSTWQIANSSLKTAQMKKATCEKQVSYFTAQITEPIVDAWCADLTAPVLWLRLRYAASGSGR